MAVKFDMKVLVQFNPQPIRDAAQVAFIKTAKVLDAKYREIIQRPGAFDGFPQDIVDTGALLANQKLTIVGFGIARYDWGVDYAILVHEGYTLRDGGTQEGRPWTKLALQELDLPRIYQGFLLQLLG